MFDAAAQIRLAEDHVRQFNLAASSSYAGSYVSMDQWTDTPVEAVAHCRKTAEARPESKTIAGLLAELEASGTD